MYLLAVILSLCAVLLPYLSSKEQKLIKGLQWHKKSSKQRLAWLGFWLLAIAAVLCVNQSYNWVVASLQVLFLIMCFACTLSLCAAHWPNRIGRVLISLSVLFMGIATLGGSV